MKQDKRLQRVCLVAGAHRHLNSTNRSTDMGVSSALHTSVSGIAASERQIDVLGDNIANAGTTGFKASRTYFATQLYQTVNGGQGPSQTDASIGGHNPQQIGLGVMTASIQQNFAQGGLTPTERETDLAVVGDGFFVLNSSTGQSYTRAGSFHVGPSTLLSTGTGQRVQGHPIDSNFQLDTTQVTDLSIPIGQLTVAEPTSAVRLGGTLQTSANAVTATQGSILVGNPFSAVAGSAASTTPITGTTALTSVFQDGSLTPAFADGDVISFSAVKGGDARDADPFQVTATTTVNDFLQHMSGTLGIRDDAVLPDSSPAGDRPGVTLTSDGAIQVVGNLGEANSISLLNNAIRVNNAIEPFGFNTIQSANGESTSTTFSVFDSEGTEIPVTVTAVLEDRQQTGTTDGRSVYRYFVESANDLDTDWSVGMGTIEFDSLGRSIPTGPGNVSIDVNSTSGPTVLNFSLDLGDAFGLGDQSALGLESRDGAPLGTLASVSIDGAGIINGSFTNDERRPLGQIVLARFVNNHGLVNIEGTRFEAGPNAGTAQIGSADVLGAVLQSGHLENSNTEIGRSLVDLITASTNYRGNARVITTTEQIFDRLMTLRQ